MVSPFTSHPDKHSIYRTDGYFARLDRCCRFFRQQSDFFSAKVYIGLLVGFLVSFTALGQTLSTVAGNGIGGFSGDDGPATEAQIQSPLRMTVDAVGNIFFTDLNRIRKISTDGIISTVAGTGFQGSSGDGGPAINAELDYPLSVVVDAGGNIFIADYGNHLVRRVSVHGIITTVAGGNNTPGASYQDGVLATTVRLIGPSYVTLDHEGNLLIVDQSLYKVFKVTSDGIINTVAGNGIQGFSGDGGLATAASLKPAVVIVDAEGNILIADAGNFCIRKVSTDGIISTIAGIPGSFGDSGDGGPATSAKFYPGDLALDAAGNLLIADNFANRIRQISTDGIISTLI
ncbi:MAG: hypothetical protein KKG00_15775, partial [Bacteroidetes bacterium]|nr:hypothetical protein [Bacteroidota bacterium]